MKFCTIAALLLVAGCKPSLQSLRAEYQKEKEKLAECERKLTEFERFNADWIVSERRQTADLDGLEAYYAAEEARRQGPEYEEDRKYIETQRANLAKSNRLANSGQAKLAAEVEKQQLRVADVETRLRQAMP